MSFHGGGSETQSETDDLPPKFYALSTRWRKLDELGNAVEVGVIYEDQLNPGQSEP